MSLRAKGIVVAYLLACSTMAAGIVAANQALQSTRSIAQRFLDAYARDAPIDISTDEIPALVADLGRAGRAWVSEDRASAEQRRYIAALAPLELADRVSADRQPDLVEWACDLLRSGAPDEFERRWTLAAVRLFARRATFGGAAVSRALRSHLEHARARFPDDSGLKLAAILARNESQAVANMPKVGDSRLVGYGWAGMWAIGEWQRVDIRPTIADLQSLSGDPSVGAEATIHLGVIEFLRGQVDAGMAHLQSAVTRTDDGYLQNLDWLMQGLAYESRGDAPAALAAYRAAFGALPTTSAGTALSVGLFRAGQRSEAAAVLEAAYQSPSGWLDPWHDSTNWRGRFADDVGRLRAMAGLSPRAALAAPRDNPAPLPDSTPAATPNRASSPAAAPAPSATAAPQFRTSTTAVVVDVSVQDGKVPVSGLTIDDFELLDNGVRQTLDAFDIGQVPLDVSIVMEMSDVIEVSSRGVLWQPQQVLADISRIAGLLKPADRIRLLETAPWGPFQPLALQSVAEAGRRSWAWAPYAVYQSSLFDATAAALLAPSAAERRSLVLLFTDGFDGASVLTPEQLLSVARESDAVVYLARRYDSYELRNQTDPNVNRLVRPIPTTAIEKVAQVTGGLVRHPQPTESMVKFFEQVLDDFRQRYLFHYTPTGVGETGWHTITVRLKKPGKYTVAARRGYFGG